MKKLTLVCSLILFAQMAKAQDSDSPYDSLWQEVERLENKALTQSALEVVQSIADKARRGKNAPQEIKALLYTSKYALLLEEDAQIGIVDDFKHRIGTTEFPIKNVLEGYLAHLYWQYFQQNRYRFYERTPMAKGQVSEDFRTWDLHTLFAEIDAHFQASLKNAEGLQQIDVSEFEPILDSKKGSKTLRPTLFDLLAHNALQFYRTDEHAITRPGDKFEIDTPEFLCGAYEFVQLEIDDQDDTSLESKALGLYQRLVAFHFSDAELDALVEVDIERLKFTYERSVFPDKSEAYRNVLQQSAENLQHHALSGLYRYEMAALSSMQANGYNPSAGDSLRWKRKEALQWCESVIDAFPGSRAAEKCRALASEIRSQSLQLTTEQHIPVQKTARILVNFRNLDSLSLTAYAIEREDIETLENLRQPAAQLTFIKKLEKTQSWGASLPDTGDYQTHGIEIPLPAMENGTYAILATPTGAGGATFAYAILQATDLAVVETRTQGNYRFQLIDRNNGNPVADASMEFFYRRNYEEDRFQKSFTTDSEGIVDLPAPSENWTSIDLRARHGQDNAWFGGFYLPRGFEKSDQETEVVKAFLFTDRSIYRPGQTIYFKGILTERIKEASSVVRNRQVSVTLHDTNGQELSRMPLESNDFGSFSGQFVLPSSGLTGEYQLQLRSDSGAVIEHLYFSVEEYKRPKFETTFEPITATYRLGDRIAISGLALAYAGSAISDGAVSYRVRRLIRFPPWHSWTRPRFQGAPQEIVQGTTRTDASGRFSFDFKAIPDRSIDRKELPTFAYEVTVDVTDINGETRSATTTVRVGYHAMNAELLLPDILEKGETDTLRITTTNLNGMAVTAKGSLKLFKLQAPDRVVRNRPWPAPDLKNWTEQEFRRLFPHEAFEGDNDPRTWEKGKRVWQEAFDTGKTWELALKADKKWPSGRYIMELEATDDFGQTVTAKRIVTLTADTDKTLPDSQLFAIRLDRKAYQPNETARLTLASAMDGLAVTLMVEREGEISATQVVTLTDGIKSVTIPISDSDMGGFAVHYSFSAFNDYLSGSIRVPVPYPNNDLDISVQTFRDKLRPDTMETWSFAIKGPKGEAVSAELLASMYDASLDAFKKHGWNGELNPPPAYYSQIGLNAHQSFGTLGFRVFPDFPIDFRYTEQQFDAFRWFGLSMGYGNRDIYPTAMMKRSASVPPGAIAEEMEEGAVRNEIMLDSTSGDAMAEEDGAMEEPTNESQEVALRQNLKETAFFLPELRTDETGSVAFDFTTPEALTRWKLQLLAHTPALQSAYHELTTVTQKELMLIPNTPRFLREGDRITISTKIANLTAHRIRGTAEIRLSDALTGKELSQALLREAPTTTFAIDSMGNTQVSWQLSIPDGPQALQMTLSAKAGDFSDGERLVLPVLTNRSLVTESLPMWVHEGQTKTFTLDRLAQMGKGTEGDPSTIRHHKLTLELTSNPAWYAIRALPYLMEFPYECSEQIFAKYYANTLAAHVANSNPRVKQVFDHWRNLGVPLGPLEQNKDLKSLLIEESPWVREAISEKEQQKRISLLFDLQRMKSEQAGALSKLRKQQMASGAWPWFSGGRPSRYITQHIIAGYGHLITLGVLDRDADRSVESMLQNAMTYLDAQFVAEYETMRLHAKDLQSDHLSPLQIHYLYMRSFFDHIPRSQKVEEIIEYYHTQARTYWTDRELYTKGMLALTFHRNGDSETADLIVRSLRENSIVDEELGMYWKENDPSWQWHRAPIETQALMIEAFSEISGDTQTVDLLKTWLLKHKQTNRWETTKATSDAIYALLLQGSDWLSVTDAVEVTMGEKRLDLSSLDDVGIEAGTGYIKTSWSGTEIEPHLAKLTLSKGEPGIAWGSLYWQYFQDLDKIKGAVTPLQLTKQVYLTKRDATGETLAKLGADAALAVGDLVRVRIELRTDRDMEFLHMKDMHAAGLEPTNVLSGYRWQDGLGYYESTRDAGTHFFFDLLPKGVYVFEYDLRVNNEGDFSNGITTVESMYAPEFRSHSNGIRLRIGHR